MSGVRCPRIEVKMQVSRERLCHFQCKSCKGWWTIGDAPVESRKIWWCPWCGQQQIVESIHIMLDVNFETMPEYDLEFGHLYKVKDDAPAHAGMQGVYLMLAGPRERNVVLEKDGLLFNVNRRWIERKVA